MRAETTLGARATTQTPRSEAEDRGFEPRRAVKPNRISSSGRRSSDSFKLGRRARSVLSVRHCTALNCNPNCHPRSVGVGTSSGTVRCGPCAGPTFQGCLRGTGVVQSR